MQRAVTSNEIKLYVVYLTKEIALHSYLSIETKRMKTVFNTNITRAEKWISI